MSEPSIPGAPGPITSPFAAIEPNVLVAGMEAAALVWVGRVAFTGVGILPTVGVPWRWWYAVLGIFVLLGLLLMGLAVEGLASIAERLITRKFRGEHKGSLRTWYVKHTHQPDSWKAGQRWMWTSPQASQEFARRRMRILVSRNTTFLVFVLWVLLTVATCSRRPSGWPLHILVITLACSAAFLLFGWVWLKAHAGWNRAVHDAGEIGAP